MKNTKQLFSLFIICMSMSCYGQSYFYSVGSGRKMAEPTKTESIPLPPQTETMSESIDTVSVELPEVVKNIKTVSLPLDDLHCTSPFGRRRDPINGTSRMHSGIDLRARFDSAYAMLPGTVTKTGYSRTGGYFVTMSHGICTCSYLHLASIIAKDGAHVSAGDIVGITGSSGRSTGPHLHIACRWNDSKGKYFNPLLLLRFVASRLK